jgi:hypothetical protein
MSEIKIETASAGGGGGGSGTVTSVAVNTGIAGTDVNRTGSPITTSGTIVINIPVASATNTGKLSNTDWITFNGKQAALVSGTNIKTVNSNSLLGAGNIDVQATLVSGTNIKTVNSNSLLGAGNLAVQDPLVSGGNINTINSASILGPGNTQLQVPLVSAVNIKTVNGNSLLGSGDLVISGGGGSPAGSTGEVQFNNAGAFGADSLYFWDNTNKRLGLGINTSLASRLHVKGAGTTSGTTSFLVQDSAGANIFNITDDKGFNFNNGTISGLNVLSGAGGVRFDSGGTTGVIRMQGNQIGLGNNSTGDPSALLTLSSTTKGFLPPKMTTTQKNAIVSPVSGLIVYDTTLNKLCVYTTAWQTITSV